PRTRLVHISESSHMRHTNRFNLGRNGRPCAPFLLSRRQALLSALAGMLTAGRARSLLADGTGPAGQVLAAATPRMGTLFTPSGAGDRDGHDWRNAMPIGALSNAMNEARPGSGFLIGFDAASQPFPLEHGPIQIRASGDASNPVFLQAGLIAGDSGVAEASAD